MQSISAASASDSILDHASGSESGLYKTLCCLTNLAGFISIGVFATHGTGYRLNHPEAIGPFLGTLVQLVGLVVALPGGGASTVKSYLSK
jgi:hypothetical protein